MSFAEWLAKPVIKAVVGPLLLGGEANRSSAPLLVAGAQHAVTIEHKSGGLFAPERVTVLLDGREIFQKALHPRTPKIDVPFVIGDVAGLVKIRQEGPSRLVRLFYGGLEWTRGRWIAVREDDSHLLDEERVQELKASTERMSLRTRGPVVISVDGRMVAERVGKGELRGPQTTSYIAVLKAEGWVVERTTARDKAFGWDTEITLARTYFRAWQELWAPAGGSGALDQPSGRST